MKTNIREKLEALTFLAGASLVVILLSSFGSAFSISKYNDQPDDLPAHEAVQIVEAVVAAEPAWTPPPVPVVQPDTSTRPARELDEADIDDVAWAEIREEMEEAMAKAKEAMDAIDWDDIREDMEAARQEAMENIDWEQIREDMEAARQEAMENIDWEQIKTEMEQAKIDARVALEAIDWDKMKIEMESVKIHLDSLMNNLDLDFDFNFDFDHDFDFESDRDLEI